MITGLRLLWRDWKGGELTLLLASLLVAIATVTSISLFADRIKNSIADQAGNLLAGDAQVRGSVEVSSDWRQKARELGLEMADVVSYQGMAFSDSGMQLSSIKAVSDTYPLKGTLTISDTPFVGGEEVRSGPPPGEVWLASRLFGVLDVEIGDRITLGEADFTITAALIKEPDSTQSFFGVGPRVMMNWSDVEQTGAVQTGSRIRYRWLLAGPSQLMDQMEQWLEPEMGDHHRWVSVKDGNQGVGSALNRAESFLLLAGSLGVILSGVALALASRRYSLRQTSHVAILKTLGLTPNQISRIYAINLIILAVISTVIGLFLGWLIHWVILNVFAGLLPESLAEPSNRPYMIGAVSGLVSLLAFSAPPILALRQIPPALVLRAGLPGTLVSDRWSLWIGVIAMIGLVYWYSGSLLLTLALAGGGAVCLLGITLVAWVLIRLTRKFGDRLGKTWRLGLASLQRHSRQNSLQVMIFSVSLLLLFVLSLVRTSLISDWQRQIPEDSPNHFAFNIFSTELDGIKNFFDQRDISSSPFYPMVRGRVTEVNGEAIAELVKEYDPADGDDYRRELNLTWSSELAEDNRVIGGQWWQPGDEQKPLVSLEQSFAEGVGITLGDELTFSIAGQKTTAKVASIRTVQWDSMRPNFYVIFSNVILDGTAASYMTSFRLQDEQKPELNQLARQYPTVSLIELDQMLNQIQSIIQQVSLAVEFILLLVLVAGILVLIASIQATLDERFRESAILRTLGARRGLVRGSLLIEFGTLGWLSGLLGVMGAEACLYFLQTQVFQIEFYFHGWLWLVGPWLGLALIGGIGLVSTTRVINTPPLTVLREV
jgi:putative ABC transport system permease protein